MKTASLRATASEVAAGAIRDMIVSGELTGGEALRVDDLAHRFGLSRTPVREAIARLAAEGFVAEDSFRTPTVFKPSARELREIYELRGAIEPLAARLAAACATSDDVQRLERLYHSLDDDPLGRDWPGVHREFHMSIYRLSDRKRLVTLIGQLRAQSEPYIRLLMTGGHVHEAQRGHHDLIEALRHNDGDGAARAAADHLNSTVRNVLADLDRQGD